MNMAEHYSTDHPDRAAIDQLPGVTLLEFGTDWCGHCQAAQPLLKAALAGNPPLRHLKVEDGKGRPLGRTFRVKLWPTLIFLRQGEEVARVIRPASSDDIRRALALADPR